MSADPVSAGLSLLAVALMLRIAWEDFWTHRIRNRLVAVLPVIYLARAALTGFDGWAGDLAAGGLLFALGFVMWLLRLMGGGDVKLYFGVGLFLGVAGLGPFAVLLLGVSGLTVLALKLSRRLKGEGPVARRLVEIARSGQLPYAVLIVAAALPVILAGLFPGT